MDESRRRVDAMTSPSRYLSTRGGAHDVGFDVVLLEGLAPDGGLYLPEAWPDLTSLAAVAGKLPYAELVARTLTPFVGDALSEQAVTGAAEEAAAAFGHPDVAPLTELEPGLFLLELFHGPTLAFKDCAMQLLAPLTRDALAARGERLLLLCATSSDTGAAAVGAFAGAANVDLVVLHPTGRVTQSQRRQMTTSGAGNVTNFAVKGDFDDCQRILKALAGDAELKRVRRVSTVNSINWARLAGQIPYYLRAASLLGAPARFVVPTGNLGDAFAGWAARACGLQMAGLTAAVNANDALARALNEGRYVRAPGKPTASVAMDVQAPSNFERLFFEVSGRDAARTKAFFETFAAKGAAELPADVRERAAESLSVVSISETDTAAETAATYKATGRIVCPHTAVALAAARRLPAGEGPIVVAATAHYGKFPESVGKAIGKVIEIPESLARLADLPERFSTIDADLAAARRAILRAFEAA
jgi:threonine synthase